MNMNQNPHNVFLLHNGPNDLRPPRIFGLTSKFVLYYQNLVTRQIVTLRLRKRHPHPARNASILLTKYRNALDRYYTSIEKITILKDIIRK